MAPPANETVSIFALTDVGRTRDHNEDAFVVCDLSRGEPLVFDRVVAQPASEDGLLLMVADGMGGAAAGEIASEMAVDLVLRQMAGWARSTRARDPISFVMALRDATEYANDGIHRYAREHPDHRGMGTTATIAGLLGDTLYLSQVGDSRAYLVRDGVARQLTKDQSLMQKLIEAGEITPEDAELSERRNIILQALGPEAAVKIDLTHQSVRRGDVLVLCSDGLSGLVKPHQIGQIVAEEMDLDLAAERLIETANDAGGPDNITVVMARFDGRKFGVASTADEVGHRVFRAPGIATPVTPSTPVYAVEEIVEPPLSERPTAEMPARARAAAAPDPAAVSAAPATPERVTNGDDRKRRGKRYIRVIAGIGAVLVGWLLWQVLKDLPR
jgi:protein phosphatase